MEISPFRAFLGYPWNLCFFPMICVLQAVILICILYGMFWPKTDFLSFLGIFFFKNNKQINFFKK